MCFSATASFVSSTLLVGTGMAATRLASGRERAFAAIPFIFAAQQFCEGVVWLSLTHSDLSFLSRPFTCAFLFFAQVLWPVWVAGSIYRIEKKAVQKKWLSLCLFLGAAVGLYLLYCLIFFPITSEIADHHIRYNLYYPIAEKSLSALLYFIPTVLPALISTTKKMRWIGLLIVGSLVVSKLYFTDYLISVWCFFAAIISIYVYVIIYEAKKARAIQAA